MVVQRLWIHLQPDCHIRRTWCAASTYLYSLWVLQYVYLPLSHTYVPRGLCVSRHYCVWSQLVAAPLSSGTIPQQRETLLLDFNCSGDEGKALIEANFTVSHAASGNVSVSSLYFFKVRVLLVARGLLLVAVITDFALVC